MLKDVIYITKKVFHKALVKKENLRNPKKTYDAFRSLSKLIEDANTVAMHYLALDFSEDFLQNSSWGDPKDKWRIFFNQDLERLNKSLKKYLQNLSYLTHEDMWETYLNKIYNTKTYYSFIRDNYSVGLVEQNCKFFYRMILKTKVEKLENLYIEEFDKIDVSTYEKRVKLQQNLLASINILKIEYEKFKCYIKERYTLEDLL